MLLPGLVINPISAFLSALGRLKTLVRLSKDPERFGRFRFADKARVVRKQRFLSAQQHFASVNRATSDSIKPCI